MQVAVIESRRQYLFAVFMTLAAMVMFSAKSLFIKFAYQYRVDTITLLVIRMGFAVPVYLMVAIISERFNQQRLTMMQWISISLLGMTGYYVSSFLDMEGLYYISASMERMVLYLYPTFVLVISALVFRQKITRTEVIGMLMAYIGIGLMFLPDIEQGNSQALYGALLVMLAALSFAVFMLGSHHHMKLIGSVRFTAYAMSAASLAVFLHFLLISNSTLLNQQHEVYQWGFVLALVSTIIPSFCLAYGTRMLGAKQVSMMGIMGPVLTLIFGSLFLNETLDSMQAAGMVIVLFAVSFIVVMKSSAKKLRTE